MNNKGKIKTKKINNFIKTVYPSRTANIFSITILFLGIILGALFITTISQNDKALVIEKIKTFINNINNDSIPFLTSFKNSVSINILYITVIWIFGMSIIGIAVNVLVLLFKSFVFGFSLASFIYTYSYKGIILSTLYTLLGQALNLIIVLTITIFSIRFTKKLLMNILGKDKDKNLLSFCKTYLIIFIFSIILSLIASIFECAIFPFVIKLIIKLFI